MAISDMLQFEATNGNGMAK